MTAANIIAHVGEEYRFRDERGQFWIVSWHRVDLPAPIGKPHGSAGICFTPEKDIVLVTWPGVAWEFPAGRLEGDEDWRATLDREVHEEACASVERVAVLGFSRGVCINGPEEGLVLVRSLWLAEVSLHPWEPKHETTGRMVVPPHEAWERVVSCHPLRPIYQRWFRDALATKGLA